LRAATFAKLSLRAKHPGRAPLPGNYNGDRNVSTASIIWLTGNILSIHIVKSDEVFHFYAGDAVEMLQLWPDGSARTVIISTTCRRS